MASDPRMNAIVPNDDVCVMRSTTLEKQSCLTILKSRKRLKSLPKVTNVQWDMFGHCLKEFGSMNGRIAQWLRVRRC